MHYKISTEYYEEPQAYEPMVPVAKVKMEVGVETPSALVNSYSEPEFETTEFHEEPPQVENIFEIVPSEESSEGMSEENFEKEGLEDNFLPGVSGPTSQDEEEENDADDLKMTNWADDRDPSKFIVYLRDAFTKVPTHDGNSISGCERALKHLNDLNREISEAIRKDSDNALESNFDEIEQYRVKILQGIVALKNRVGELRKKIKQEGSQKKKASESNLEDFIKDAVSGSNSQIEKEASAAKMQMVVTPFERAVTGIIVNAVVSAGHPFEDVYEFLKKKFEITPREELAILQIVMDMGFPIFKDRGLIGGKEESPQESKEDGHGIDFIKNYFA